MRTKSVGIAKIDWVKASPWLCTFGLFAIWEASVWVFSIPYYILPAPTQIGYAMYEFSGALWFNSIQTLWTTLLGFAMAIVIWSFTWVVHWLGQANLCGTLPIDDRIQLDPQRLLLCRFWYSGLVQGGFQQYSLLF